MTLSRKLLHHFFPQFEKFSDADLETLLNSIGVEVEQIFKFHQTKNLIVGIIKSVAKHPKSDNLNVCEVEFNKSVKTIVCGAHNVAVNKKVIVAPVGTSMLDGRLIEKRNILGLESNGMICSYLELSDRTEYLPQSEMDDIILLDDSAKADDEEPLKYIGLDDTIFELSIPSNRNELNGILALGYDLILVANLKYKLDAEINLTEFKKSKIRINAGSEKVNFFGLIEATLPDKELVSWKVKSFLMNSSVTPKNSIVDLTNLLMISTCNPTHVFSADKIGDEIEIKDVADQQTFETLIDTKVKLDKNDLVVSSKNKPVAIAGVIGSKDSAFQNETKEVVFEIANYLHTAVRKTSSRLKLNTDASQIFGKKIPLWITFKTFETALIILKSIGVKVNSINYTQPKFETTKIKYDYKKIINLLGLSISKSSLDKTLKELGFKIVKSDLIPPFYRIDLTNINDVVEEIVKKIDINNLQPVPIEKTFVSLKRNIYYDNFLFINNHFGGKGFVNVKTYNLTSLEKNKKFNIFNSKDDFTLINPSSAEREVFRNSLIEKQLEVFSLNKSYKNKLVPIFETQGVYVNKKLQTHLVFTVASTIYENKIDGSGLKPNLLLIKSLVTDFLKNFTVDFEYEKYDGALDFVYENNSLNIMYGKRVIGVVGQISKHVTDSYKINHDVFFAEINIEDFINRQRSLEFKILDFDRKHQIVRDLSILIGEGKFKTFLDTLKKFENVSDYIVNDIYKTENGLISYNISFTLKVAQEQPTIEDINLVFNELIKFVENDGFKIRKS